MGADCFNRFNGIWAIVIYDKVSEEIVVSRDRFGMKPLFICKNKFEIIISSEIEPITILKKPFTKFFEIDPLYEKVPILALV